MSFFAYAPYKSGQRWDGFDVSTSSNSDKLYVTFSVNEDATTQEDLLWATPQLNMSNKKTGNVNDLSSMVEFTMKHITSKVQLLVGVTKGNAADAWKDTNTVVILKSIKFNGLNSQFKYTYTIASDGQIASDPAVSCNGCEESVYDLSIEPGASVDTITVHNWADTTNTASTNLFTGSHVKSYGYYYPYMDKQADTTAFLFLAPQTFSDQSVSITYVVKTTDGNNSRNCSTITNTVTKKLSDVIDTLKTGQAYRLKFLIGLDDVNLSASVTDWNDAVTYGTGLPSTFAISISTVSANWTVSDISCTGSGAGTSGDTLSFKVAHVVTKSPGTESFVCTPTPGTAISSDNIPEEPSDKSMMNAGTFYKTESGNITTIRYIVPEINPATSIVIGDYTFPITVTGVEDKWTVDSLSCTGTGLARAGETVSFIVTASNGANGFSLQGMTEDTVNPQTPDSGKYGISGTGPYNVKWTLSSDVDATTAVELQDRSYTVTNDSGSDWDFNSSSVICTKSNGSGNGFCRTGDLIKFTVTAKSGSEGRIFYLQDGNTKDAYSRCSITESPAGTFAVVDTIGSGDTFPIDMHIVDAGVKVSVLPADTSSLSVSGVKCSGTHSYQSGEILEFIITPSGDCDSFRLSDQDNNDFTRDSDYTIVENAGTPKTYTVSYTVPEADKPVSIIVSDDSSRPQYTDGSYVGKGILIGTTYWAPVNCGYDANHPYGLLYQWGRKYGQGYRGESPAVDSVSFSSVYTTHVDTDSTSNHNKFYYSTTLQIWYGGEEPDKLWDTTGGSSTAHTPSKGSWDPCPSGWRVPTSAELASLIGGSSLKSGDFVNQTRNVGGVLQKGHWFDGTGSVSATTGVFLPAAGIRNRDNGRAFDRFGDQGYNGVYWSSSCSGNNASHLVFKSDGAQIAEFARANGYSVRCVKE